MFKKLECVYVYLKDIMNNHFHSHLKKKREQNNADAEGKISVNLKQGYTFLGYVLSHSKQLITS